MDPFLLQTFITPNRLIDSFNVLRHCFPKRARLQPEQISAGDTPRDTYRQLAGRPHRRRCHTRG